VNDIIVNAWAQISDDCAVSYVISGDDVEFSLGGRDGFQLIVSERGLATLAETCAKALADLRAR
jgi:hypothetical protein